MCVGMQRVGKPVCLPILHQRGKDADMGNANPRIMRYRPEESPYGFAPFHAIN
ncbi:hypothetical protein [Mucilaginibacter aquaedulcis]|uniref:hypothetical protein n=1 Tax=Mucilaginibacter aquaedulcis TaxID=1187081 RepID=UPI0025B52B6E|nr:hypothetical protein [Mucilaginibacter aquaedulcis]MDN3548978.1 hypothetical protein [Mucilaginibacter aquaedulcis]